MSWQETPLSLESKSWRVLQLNGTEYLLKGHFEDANYHVMLCDLCTIWEETLRSEDILQRSKTLNPSIEVPLSVLLKRLSDDISGSQSDSSFRLPASTPSQPHSLTLSLTTTLASLPFQWKFNLEHAPPNAVCVHLVEPLLAMVRELSHRGEEMARLLACKDREIQDYKEQGAEVSRKYLETVPFTEKAFTAQHTSSSGFAVRAHKSQTVLGQSSVQELYQNVTRAKLWAQRNSEVVEEFSDTAAHGVSSPVTSPVKKPPPESPSKEDEEARRKELERKLGMEKQKPKKKKRRLM